MKGSLSCRLKAVPTLPRLALKGRAFRKDLKVLPEPGLDGLIKRQGRLSYFAPAPP
jgi:hypothetical protein